MSATMDDFIDGARRYADIAATKTNEFIEVSKLRLDKTRLQSKVREQYQKLGRLCYDMSEKGSDRTGEMKSVIEVIRTLKKDIAWTDEQIKAAKPHRKCSVCGADCADDCTFCPVCGEKL